MQAYLIKTHRYHVIPNEKLLEKVKQEDISKCKTINDTFDFNQLITLRNLDPAAFEQIIYEGYRVKFLTINGLQNLLKLKFNKFPEKDFVVTKKGIKCLNMTDEQLRSFQELLSNNWVVINDSKKGIRVELLQSN